MGIVHFWSLGCPLSNKKKIESKWYVLFYSQNYGDFTLCDTVTPGTGLWMIQQSFEIPTCVAMHINKSPVLPIVSEAPCPNGLIFTTGRVANPAENLSVLVVYSVVVLKTS